MILTLHFMTGISAHRLCKERVVIECRPKRISGSLGPRVLGDSQQMAPAMPRNRSMSSTSTSARKKSSFKQKSTQTEMYDDLFISDDSLSSKLLWINQSCCCSTSFRSDRVYRWNNHFLMLFWGFSVSGGYFFNSNLRMLRNGGK